jgi:hypothetical protein
VAETKKQKKKHQHCSLIVPPTAKERASKKFYTNIPTYTVSFVFHLSRDLTGTVSFSTASSLFTLCDILLSLLVPLSFPRA